MLKSGKPDLSVKPGHDEGGYGFRATLWTIGSLIIVFMSVWVIWVGVG